MRSLLNQIAHPLLGTFNHVPTELQDKPVWFAPSIANGKLELEVELECGEKIGANQALLQFQFADDSIDYLSHGFSKSHRDEVGYYAYLPTQMGRNRQRLSFNIPNNQQQLLVGIRTWCADDWINLHFLSDSASSGMESDRTDSVDVLLSVDVEALPGRALDRHVDRLIWGGAKGEAGHGIGRLEKIFSESGVKATFYVDFSSCCIHGDAGIFEAAQYLVAKGQDVQLHVHSEVLVRNQHWVHDAGVIPTFALHSFSTAKRAIEYAAEKFTKSLGYRPSIFRAGGLWWCTASVLATGINGIHGASNVSPTRAFAPSSDVFNWENGVTELPVDFCLDPYIQNGCESLLSDVELILENKTHRVISCYLHSWSLSPRTPEGYHLEHSERYQRNLEEAIAKLKTIGSLSTSSTEYLERVRRKKSLITVPLTWNEKELNVRARPNLVSTDHCACCICSTNLIRARLKNDVCPHCRLRTRHRILRSVLDRQLGDLFDGKRVIANHADPNEIKHFFGNAKSVMNFDVRPLDYLDTVADVQDLSQFAAGSFDVFYSIYVLNHVTDDSRALAEMSRVIANDGLAVIMVPFHVNARTRLHTDITQNYGKDALEKYGVGSYRYYGYSDVLSLLQKYFNVTVRFGRDPITDHQDAVFVCHKKKQ